MASIRNWCAAAACLTIVLGCGTEATPPSALCIVTAHDGAERAVLLSEARAARDAGQRTAADFTLAVPGFSPIELQLTSIGCNCYQVQREERAVAVGERFSIAAGGATRVQIVSQPSVEPGIRQFHAEFEGRRADRSLLTIPLVHAVRTLADLVVRPDVAIVEIKPQRQSPGDSFTVTIEQHVRTDTPDEIVAAWDQLPAAFTATVPVQREPPVEVSMALWRVRWQSVVTAHVDQVQIAESPHQLPLVSRLRDRELARTNCTVVTRRRSGVSAPSLVHFGRLSRTTSSVRRIQLRALDDRPFVIASVETRDGGVEAIVTTGQSQREHWLEVRAAVPEGILNDVLMIETDHPDCPRLQISVKGLGSRSSAR